MSRINTNVASLRGLRNYNKANKLLDTSLTRLSTGLQINSGKDNPSGLIASETLRLQVTSIEQSIKNSNRANNVIATADGALGEIGGLLNQIRGLVQEGLNEGALSQAEKEANQLQIDTALSAINRISSNTSFAGDRLLDGSKAFNTSISTADSAKLTDFKVNEAVLGTNESINIDATVTSQAEKAQLAYFGGGLTERSTIEVGGSSGNELLFLGDSASVEDIAAAINGVSDSTGVNAAVKNALQLGSEEGVAAELSAAIGSATAATFSFDAIEGTASSLDFEAVSEVAAQQTVVIGATAQAESTSIATGGAGAGAFTVAAVAGEAADGTAGNDISIVFTDAGAGNALSATFDEDSREIRIALDTDTPANNTAAAIETAIEAINIDGGGTDFAVTVDNAGTFSFADDGGTTVALNSNTAGVDNVLTIDADTAGTDGNNIQVTFTSGAAAAVSVSGAGTEDDPTIIAFTVAAGNDVDDLQALLAAGATQDAVDAAALITLSATDETVTGFDVPADTLELEGGLDAAEVTFTANETGTAGDDLTVTVTSGATENSVSVSGSDVTFNLRSDATVADLVSLLDDPQTADEVAAAELLSISYNGSGLIPTDTIANTQTQTNLAGGVDTETVTFTADTAGEDGNDLSVNVSTGAAATSVSVDGDTINISLATGATIDDLATLLDSPSTTGETAAAALIDISYSGANASSAVANTATDQALTGGAEAATIDITAKTNGDAGNNIQVQFEAAALADAEPSVSISGAGTEADPTIITFTLGTDSDGAVNSTVADIQALLSNGADGSDAATANDLIEIAPADGTATSTVISATTLNTAESLANGTDSTTTLTVIDNRADDSTGTISVEFVVGTGDEISATVGAADEDGNQTITFNLVDDTTGAVTSTVDDLKALIAEDESLRNLVSIDGTAGGTLFSQSATELQGGENAAVVLSSENYGSAESVSLNVLGGSFDTVNTTGAVSSRDVGVDIGVTINGQNASTSGLDATIRTSTLDATISFQSTSNVVEETTSITVTGGGSLFQIGQEVNPSGQIGIGLEAVNTARLGGITGKLFELGTGNGKSLLDVGTGGVSGQDLVDIIDQSLERVTTLRGRLGALQKNVIETNISTLGVALENISEARSQITDTDFAIETAALTKAQILQQSGISVLSIANQAPQQVLSLLG